ncbi:MAG: preprotein translocase subunit SecE [Alphaproteobacteria bacterium]|nr:preprotein translocase subunit SecE [Alphaproteobacteria bacterium]
MANIIELLRETKREIAKVTWPTKRETVITTIMIIAMALLAGAFFFVTDGVLGYVVGKILGMRN